MVVTQGQPLYLGLTLQRGGGGDNMFSLLGLCRPPDSSDSELELSMVRHQPEGLEQLQAQTKFTKKELQSLYRGFKNVSAPHPPGEALTHPHPVPGASKWALAQADLLGTFPWHSKYPRVLDGAHVLQESHLGGAPSPRISVLKAPSPFCCLCADTEEGV